MVFTSSLACFAMCGPDYAILTYILHFFALCCGPKGEIWHNALPPKYAPGCAYLKSHGILVTACNYSTSVFIRRGLFFVKSFIYNKI